MATLNEDSPFVSWKLTPEEMLHGGVFSGLQTQYLQNYVHELAVRKLNLLWSEDTKNEFIELGSQIALLQFLLATSVDNQKQILDLAKYER